MFQKTDFWIGLAVGAVAGIFGYRFMQEREQQMAMMQHAAPTAELPVAELQRQKEELEDLKMNKLKDVHDRLRAARALGDLSDNPEYDAARAEMKKIWDRIDEIENLLENADKL